MFAQYLFNLVSRFIFSRWVRDYTEHHGAQEEAFTGRLGPLHLEINQCFVLDHDDAWISLRPPILVRNARGWEWGRLHLGYVVCLGADEIRRPGFYTRRHKPLPKVVYGRGQDSAVQPFPF